MCRRIISGILSTLMALNIVTMLPANVFAVTGDSHVYEKDGYTVTYKIGNKWDNNRKQPSDRQGCLTQKAVQHF